MLKIKIFTKGVFQREVHQPAIDSLDYTLNGYGLPERIVVDTKGQLAMDGVTVSDGGYDEVDVIERYPEVMEDIINEHGETVTKVITPAMVKLKPEYTLEVVDLELDYDYKLQKCIANRIKEYPDMGEFLNAYFDDGEAGLLALKQKRQAIKQKYPKPIKQ